MTERPINLKAWEVRAILDGRKTQTRRVMKPQPEYGPLTVGVYAPTVVDRHGIEHPGPDVFGAHGDAGAWRSPFGAPGDRLWVKETWQHAKVQHCLCAQASEPVPCDDWQAGGGCRSDRGHVVYRADGLTIPYRWRPSVHMPRWASRLTLEVESVRVQRVQDISEEDVLADGYSTSRGAFAGLWDAIHGQGAWDHNDLVWAVAFLPLLSGAEIERTHQ